MKLNSIPELLAPAGSMDALKAAVIAGADAIYLAGKNFSARYYAENFNRIEMEEAIDYSHLNGSKVYVTINTLIKDFELEKVAEYLIWLYKIGADAVILQDIGVAALCRDLVPKLDMHASTQMTINSLEEVKWAENFGFKRVVLSREMKVEEINEIAYFMKRNEIELEIFAHGALCYCYSGQCLLSSFIGGRSSNRGRCAQPCRKSYEFLKGDKDQYGKIRNQKSIPIKENYLLSTRDLSLYNNLEKIYNLIDSIKIEGRMRLPEYVAIVVSIYRELLDSIVQGTGIHDEKDNYYKLKLAFNRNFTKGHLLETNKNLIMGRDAPGNRGLFIGLVSDYENKSKSTLINLKIPFKLEKGDGIVFIFPDKEQEYGMIIEKPPNYSGKKFDEITLKTKKVIPIGSKVYITRDASLIKTAQKIINKETPSIPMDLNIKWDKENKLLLKGEFVGINWK